MPAKTLTEERDWLTVLHGSKEAREKAEKSITRRNELYYAVDHITGAMEALDLVAMASSDVDSVKLRALIKLLGSIKHSVCQVVEL